MGEKIGGGIPPQEGATKSPELLTITVGEMVQKFKNDPKLQKKAFGKVLTNEEFEDRFPNSGVTVETLRTLASALGLELPSEEVARAVEGGHSNVVSFEAYKKRRVTEEVKPPEKK